MVRRSGHGGCSTRSQHAHVAGGSPKVVRYFRGRVHARYGHVERVRRAGNLQPRKSRIGLLLPLVIIWPGLERMLAGVVAHEQGRAPLTSLHVDCQVGRCASSVNLVVASGLSKRSRLLRTDSAGEALLLHADDTSIRRVLDVELDIRAVAVAALAPRIDADVVVAQTAVRGRAESLVILADVDVVAVGGWLREVLVPQVRILLVDQTLGGAARGHVEVQLWARRFVGATCRPHPHNDVRVLVVVAAAGAEREEGASDVLRRRRGVARAALSIAGLADGDRRRHRSLVRAVDQCGMLALVSGRDGERRVAEREHADVETALAPVNTRVAVSVASRVCARLVVRNGEKIVTLTSGRNPRVVGAMRCGAAVAKLAAWVRVPS
mmetsp:Transcript_10055/g.35226  ORF Transcript_10055/g.35226 Transcript_10055/m.35226 type:complete len:380 (-) Transcript_10055:3554-4693(-)